MSAVTSIEWADRTWSPLIGCDKVSPGCDHCYAITTSRLRSNNPHPAIAAAFAGTTERNEDGVTWTGKVNLLEERLTEPLRWRKPSRVFVNSMSDLFHQDVPIEFIARVFAMMALASQHTFQILTKRHARMASVLTDRCTHAGHPHRDGIDFRSWMAWSVSKANPNRPAGLPDDAEHRVYFETPWPLPNVWLGVSVENQKWADIRIPALLRTPAAVRFLSCEPLLGPIDLTPNDHSGHRSDYIGSHEHVCLDCSTEATQVPWSTQDFPPIDWVIVGGESGLGARAMHPDWARSLRDQCVKAKVPYLFKQWGAWGPAEFSVRVCDPQFGWLGTREELAVAKRESEAVGATHVHTGNWWVQDGEKVWELHEISSKPWSLERCSLPEGTEPMRRWGKKAAGRDLDGRTWDQYPGGAL